jgi:hypothetical protein
VTRREVWLEPEVHAARKRLPGNVRHRLKRAIDGLADDPRPFESLTLDVSGLGVPPGVELRQLRINRQYWGKRYTGQGAFDTPNWPGYNATCNGGEQSSAPCPSVAASSR